MSGISIILELARKKNPSSSYSSQTLHSHSLFSAAAAAAAVAAGKPFTSRFLFGNFRVPVAYCDAGATWTEDFVPHKETSSILQDELGIYGTKQYNIELKPLFSAFEPRSFAMTSLRSFLLYYLPLLEPRTNLEEDDDDFIPDTQEERRVDLVVPFKKSVKQIIRETTNVTTRRILERLAFHYISQRMAWKLLKDVPKSAARKAQRGMPTMVFIWSVSKTTFRGYLLGVLASWLVQVSIETYRCLSRVFHRKEEDEDVDPAEEFELLAKKVGGATIKYTASLVFASIGAGIGAALIRPSLGQWIGCAIGDLTGPVLASFCFQKYLLTEI
ncbi:hypothetical protein MLD38_000911 [Melastoma candidum]|uniref:Uncharacterized protein n=1 Tax=Melastoma candidum TaxID=119954 RepID=A0ACB9SK77_9MYRT|nr:hypothetical protein MLD38_000911 [Melastoma candidum]